MGIGQRNGSVGINSARHRFYCRIDRRHRYGRIVMDREMLNTARGIREEWNHGSIACAASALLRKLQGLDVPYRRADRIVNRWWRRKARRDGVVLQVWDD